jgi:hypothetical protein
MLTRSAFAHGVPRSCLNPHRARRAQTR